MYAAAVAAALALALTAQVWAVDPVRASQQISGTQKLWVFFTDKGLTRAEEASAIDAFRAELPERALRRRAKVGFDVNINDLPVAAQYVGGVAATGATVVMRSRWLNAVSVYADDQQAGSIAALPFVRDMRPVGRGTKRLPEMVPADGQQSAAPAGRVLDYGESQGQLEQIQIDQLHASGLDGTGVLIAMLDTGFDTDHQVYRHLGIVAERDFINNDGETADQPGDPEGQDGHGTATLSCVGGKYPGELYGGSYSAGFVLCKTEILDEEIQTEEDYWEAAVEWADSLGADVVSSSLGYLDWYTYEDMDGNTAVTTIAADMAAARGIVVVNSMGNEGYSEWLYMIAPADGDSVLSIGAVDIYGDRVAFSSVGPTYDGRMKPDVMALGLAAYVATTGDTASYANASGTSFSCPLTAGAVGLLVQAHPDWSPMDIIEALRSTATQSASPDTLMGWGIVQAHDAMYAGWAGVEDGAVTAARVIWATPNPTSRGTLVEFIVPERGRALVTIYDASGRLVRTLTDRVMLDGRHAAEWDGRDESLHPVASGVYFARLRAAGGVRSSTKVAVVR
jgi:subtilisin family serine protease